MSGVGLPPIPLVLSHHQLVRGGESESPYESAAGAGHREAAPFLVALAGVAADHEAAAAEREEQLERQLDSAQTTIRCLHAELLRVEAHESSVESGSAAKRAAEREAEREAEVEAVAVRVATVETLATEVQATEVQAAAAEAATVHAVTVLTGFQSELEASRQEAERADGSVRAAARAERAVVSALIAEVQNADDELAALACAHASAVDAARAAAEDAAAVRARSCTTTLLSQ